MASSDNGTDHSGLASNIPPYSCMNIQHDWWELVWYLVLFIPLSKTETNKNIPENVQIEFV